MRLCARYFAAAMVSLMLAPAAHAATVVTGDHDTNMPLEIVPDTDPFVGVMSISSGNGPTVAFIQEMPVTKRIDRITVGDLANAPSCSTDANVMVRVWKHDPPVWGPPGGSGSTQQVVSSPVTLTATLSRVNFTIAPTTLEAGKAYSFTLSKAVPNGCLSVSQRGWAHNQPTVRSGPVTSTCVAPPQIGDASGPAGFPMRMWHQEGLNDRNPNCAAAPPPEAVFDPTMPTGWLLTLESASRSVAGGSTLTSSPPSSPCETSGAVEWAFWKTTGTGSSTRWKWVCRYTQFAPPGDQTVPHGWYHGAPWWGAKQGAPRDVYLKLETIDYEALLGAYSPILKYDVQELMWSNGVAPFVEYWQGAPDENAPGSIAYFATNLKAGDGHSLATAATTRPEGDPTPVLTLSQLDDRYPFSGELAGDDDFLDGPPYDPAEETRTGQQDDAQEMQNWASQRTLTDRVYGRVLYDSDGDLWLQYWLFYYLNDQYAAGDGTHEGDWEDFQVRLDPSLLTPELAVFGAHSTDQQACLWTQVEKDPLGGTAPYVYPANAGHGNYPYAGVNPRGVLPDDEHWGAGREIRPQLEIVTEASNRWIMWPGRWGGDLTGFSVSPIAPRRQDPDWGRPNDYANAAVDCDSAPSGASVSARRLSARRPVRKSRPGAPPAPRLRGRSNGRRILISYSFARYGALPASRRPRFLMLSAHSRGRDVPPTGRKLPIRVGKGQASLVVPYGTGPVTVRASAFTRNGVRSAIVKLQVGR